MRAVALVWLGSMLWGVSLCVAQGAQEAPPPDAIGPPTILADQNALFAAASASQTTGQPSWIVEGRACEGCPPRSVGRALFQTTFVNVLYGLVNLARGQVTALITPKTWWANMEQGWVWDSTLASTRSATRIKATTTQHGPGQRLELYESAADSLRQRPGSISARRTTRLERLHQHDWAACA